MADTFYGVPAGGPLTGTVVTSSTTTGDVIELRLHAGSGLTKTQVSLALKSIEAVIQNGSELA